MKLPHRRSTLVAIVGAGASAFAQRPGMPKGCPDCNPRLGADPPQIGGEGDAKLPNGKSQRDEILKADHEKNLKDAADLVELAQQLQLEIEKNDAFVFSLSALQKTDDMEKLVKKIRARLRHR
jgi:hypothetical protein